MNTKLDTYFTLCKEGCTDNEDNHQPEYVISVKRFPDWKADGQGAKAIAHVFRADHSDMYFVVYECLNNCIHLRPTVDEGKGLFSEEELDMLESEILTHLDVLTNATGDALN